MKNPKRLASVFILILSLIFLSACATTTTTTFDHRADEYHDYLTQEFPNYVIKKVFLEYNPYYAGYFVEGATYVVVVLEDSPQELFDLLAEKSMPYRTGKYSYNNLLVLRDLIMAKMGENEISMVGINEVENCVKVGVSGEETPDFLKDYVRSGIVVIQTNCIFTFDLSYRQ